MQGGDISAVYVATLDDGRDIIAKQGGPCRTEARMLQAVAAAGCRAPDVLHADADLLLMTRLAEGSGSDAAWADAGAQIARLHASHGARYGWPEDTAFGPAPCPAAVSKNWPEFWAERRLLAWPDALPADLRPRLARLAARLPDLLPHDPAPSLLHGDLWQGNVLMEDDRFSGLIDPACYHGHAEVDLAMLCVFGKPPRAFWNAYGPLEDGWDARRPIYQLWPALVHLRLFGAGYRGMVESLLTRVGA
ncbi:fructosamine kinase family protein [Maribius pontilimi]|uniref:Fructosamine kinase family protein n=2 Tax=Palleronia pontilimi TaxID=1964209 RepID=A0A934I7Q9_9RHOB|nr:fructosamine kinase family protein [Palleronia pontilimi]